MGCTNSKYNNNKNNNKKKKKIVKTKSDKNLKIVQSYNKLEDIGKLYNQRNNEMNKVVFASSIKSTAPVSPSNISLTNNHFSRLNHQSNDHIVIGNINKHDSQDVHDIWDANIISTSYGNINENSLTTINDKQSSISNICMNNETNDFLSRKSINTRKRTY